MLRTVAIAVTVLLTIGVAAPSAIPSAAAAESVWEPAAGSPWADVEPVDAATTAEFVATWTARFEAGGDAVRPTEEELDRYRSLTAAQRRGLVVALVRHWYDEVDGFAAAMAGELEGPEWTSEALAGMVYVVIFEPERLAGDAGAPPAGDVPADEVTAAAHDELLAAASAALAGAAPIDLASGPDLAAPLPRDVDIADITLPGGLALPALPAADAGTTSSGPIEDLQREVARALEAPEPIVSEVDAILTSAAALPASLANSRFRACQKPAGAAAECGPLTPLGVPALVPGGADWHMRVNPFDLTTPGQITFGVDLSKVDPASTRTGHFFVVYRPPGFDRDVTLGFGDRAPLQATQAATVTVDDPAQHGAERTLALTAAVTRDGAEVADLALTAAYGAYSGRLLVDDGPRALTAQLRAPLSGSPLRFGLRSPGGPVLHAEAATPFGRFSGLVDDVPSAVDLTVTRGDRFGVRYGASGPIERVAVTASGIALASGVLDAQVFVDGVPKGLAVDAGAGGFSVTGSAGIGAVRGTAVVAAAPGAHPQRMLDVSAAGIPASFSFTGGTSNGVPTHTYSASGRIDAITGAYAETTATGAVAMAGGARLTGLPSTLTLQAPAGGFSADLGDGRVDSIEAWASIGTGEALLPRADLAANQLQYRESSSTQLAHLRILGFESASFAETPGGFIADAALGGGHGLDAAYSDPTRRGTLRISNVPGQVTVGVGAAGITYDAHGDAVQRIDADVAVPGLAGVASVVGVPSQAALGGDLKGGGLRWSASAPVTSVSASLTAGADRAVVGVEGVPTLWTLIANDARVDFDAPAGVGRVFAAAATNQSTIPTLSGDHVAVRFDQAADRAAASLAISGVRRVAYANGSPRTLSLRAGSGGDLNLYADGTLADGRAAMLSGAIRKLPTAVDVAVGNDGSVDARVDRRAALTLYGAFGSRAAISKIVVPLIHGIAIRDARAADGLGYRGVLNLVGLPTRVAAAPGRIRIEGAFGEPGYTSLGADVLLDDASPRRSLKASLAGMSTDPYVIDGTFSVVPVTGGGSDLAARLVTNRSLGSLSVAVAEEAVSARAAVSSIPDDISLVVHERPGSTQLKWAASAPIASVSASVKAGFDAAVSGAVRATATLTDLPRSVDITLGRDGAGAGPLVGYAADADTLDASVFADGSLAVPSGQVAAKLSFSITNLARDVRTVVDSSTRRLTLFSPSNRTTGRIAATVSARASFSKTGSGVLNQGAAVSFPYSWGVGVSPVLQGLFLSVQGLRAVSIDPGVSSRLTGSWDLLSTGWTLAGASIWARGDLDAEIDWPWPFGSSRFDFLSASVSANNLPLFVDFHRYQALTGAWASFSWDILGCGVDGVLDIKPRPIGATRNGFSLNDPADDGGAYFVTPNPFGVVPAWLVDVITFASRPEGSMGVRFWFSC